MRSCGRDRWNATEACANGRGGGKNGQDLPRCLYLGPALHSTRHSLLQGVWPMVLPRPLHRSGLASMRRRVTLRAGLIPQTMRVAMPSTPSNFRIRSVTGVVSLMYSILMEDPPHVLGNDGHPWGSGDRFGCCSPSLSPSYPPSGIISAGGSLHEEKNVIGWSWADGGRVGRSCRICCPDTHERSDGHAGDQWHDLRFLRCHSAVCAAISEGC